MGADEAVLMLLAVHRLGGLQAAMEAFYALPPNLTNPVWEIIWMTSLSPARSLDWRYLDLANQIALDNWEREQDADRAAKR